MLGWLAGILRGRERKTAANHKGKTSQAIRPTPAPSPRTREPKHLKQIVVGIDFGTSGTKVVYHDLQTRKHYLFCFGHEAEGYPDYVMPSSIQISNGRVYFGAQAEEPRPGSTTFRSFKVCLAAEAGIARCRHTESGFPRRGQAHLTFKSSEHDLSISAQEAVTWYVAHIMGLAHQHLMERWGKDFRLKLWWNVGAPVDQYNAPHGEEAFAKAAFWAEKMSSSAWDGKSLHALLCEYDRVSNRWASLPDEAESATFVRPETAAALAAFVNSPNADEGLYAIVDVGAGTTDVSFFRLAELQHDQPRTMAFYDARTEIVGSDNIDMAIAELAASRIQEYWDRGAVMWDSLLLSAKRGKEGLDQQGELAVLVGSRSVVLGTRDIEQAAKPVVESMVSNYVSTNRRSYRKEPKTGRWAEFTAFLLGGGSRLRLVECAFAKTRPSPYNEHVKWTRLMVPRDLEASADAKSSFELIAIAYGLSYPVVDFPSILNPSEVEPLMIDWRSSPRPDRDDLYPKP